MNNNLKRNLMLIVLSLTVVAMVGAVFSNVIEESIVGSGSMQSEHRSKSASDDAGVQNAKSVDYEVKRTWGAGEPSKFDSSFMVTGSDSKGSYKNRYIVKSSGAGYKHQYRAYYTGDFAGSAEVTLSVGERTESLDSIFRLDSSRGNASFQGRIYNGRTGKPISESETDAVGSFVINSYLNITETEKPPEDWLGFCNSVNRDINSDPELNGIYVLPANTSLYNYTIVDGMVVRMLNTSRVR